MRKSHVLLIAAGLLTGVFVTMVGSATEYEEIDTVAEGVYMVHGDDNRFKIAAEDDVKVLVYGKDGDLVLARSIEAGRDRSFVLDDGAAIVGLYGGEATIAAAGEGAVDRVPVEHRKVELVSGDGGPLHENVTVQLPSFLVGVTGALKGEAYGITATATTEKGVVFSASDAELYDLSESMAVEALDAEIVDVQIDAEHLDGSLYIVFAQPARSVLERLQAGERVHVDHDRAAEQHDELPDKQSEARGIEIAELSHMPLRFELGAPATLVFDVDHGYMLDAALYDEEGLQVEYIHRGADLAEARQGCQDISRCWWYDYGGEEVEEETIEVPLDRGTYLLFIRVGWVDGFTAIVDDSGEPIDVAVDVLEIEHEGITAEDNLTLEHPILDVGIESWGLDAFEEIVLSLDGEPVYTYSAVLNAFGFKTGSEHTYDASLLGPGTLTLEADGLVPESMFNEAYAWVAWVDIHADGEDLEEHLEEHHDDEDEDDEDDDGHAPPAPPEPPAGLPQIG